MRLISTASILFLASGLASRVQAQIDRDPESASYPSGTRRAVPATDDAELGRSPRLETVLRIALHRNRDVAEDQARAAAAEARSRAASRLPDPELKYEQWAVPLSRPTALDRADTLMLGVRQTFPAWGTLDARGRAGAEEAGGAQDTSRARWQEVAAQVRRTYATYYKADQELRLHLEHVGLTSRVLELARLNQRTGHGSLQDILRLELEMTRLHTDVARIEREQQSSRALLNALMDRPPEAPLGPPEDLALAWPKFGCTERSPSKGDMRTGSESSCETPPGRDIADLEKSIDMNRPEIGAAARAVRRSQALLDGARRSTRFPNVMVGLDYWYMPTNADMHHAYGAMVAINLPWLSERHRDEEREAEQTVHAEQRALESTKNVARYELHDASARLESARQTFAIIDQELLAQARRSVEATQAAYAAGQGDTGNLLDALRSYLQVRIERVRALAELASSQADLERAAGTLTVAKGDR